MWARTLGAAAALLLAIALVGCGGGSDSTEGGESGDASSGASAESTEAVAAPYPAIAPESANEKNAMANIDKALAQQVESSKLTAEEGGSEYYFSNEEGYKPLFIGHQVTLFTEQKENGRWGQYPIVVLGDKVTVDSIWDRAAGLTRDNGMLGEQFWTFDSDFNFYESAMKYSPESAAEKNAVELAAAWGEENLSDVGPLKAELTGYIFVYGNPGDVPNMILTATPDGMAKGSVVTNPQ